MSSWGHGFPWIMKSEVGRFPSMLRCLGAFHSQQQRAWGDDKSPKSSASVEKKNGCCDMTRCAKKQTWKPSKVDLLVDFSCKVQRNCDRTFWRPSDFVQFAWVTWVDWQINVNYQGTQSKLSGFAMSSLNGWVDLGWGKPWRDSSYMRGDILHVSSM